jgi:D-alanyl-D-alanine carboxypeptidase
MRSPDPTRMRLTRGVLAAAVLAVVVGASAVADVAQPIMTAQPAVAPAVLKQRLQAAFDALHDAAAFPGGTAGFVLADGTSISVATGYSDPAAQTPMLPSDRMLMGSVGKTYVSAVALQLAQERRLALADRIQKWLGSADWFARLPNARHITVRMLMNHTSGLAPYEYNEKFTADLTNQPDKTWRPEELLSYILDTEPPFAAGAGWLYSDANYILLGFIIERVTGSTYYQQLARRLLIPFKLRDTVPSNSRTIPGLVPGFAGPDNPFGGVDAMMQGGVLAIDPQFEWTGGGLASTSLDLARWAKVLYEGHAFNKVTLAELIRGVPAELGPNTRYGLGVMIRQTPLGVSYGHSGFFPGYQTEMAYFPAIRAAVAVQVNSSAEGSTGKPLQRYLSDFAQILSGRS